MQMHKDTPHMFAEEFLLDPSPIIALPCHSVSSSMTMYRCHKNIIAFKHNAGLHQLLLEDKEGVRESNMLSLTSRIATLCRSCLTISSSSSFPVCLLTCQKTMPTRCLGGIPFCEYQTAVHYYSHLCSIIICNKLSKMPCLSCHSMPLNSIYLFNIKSCKKSWGSLEVSHNIPQYSNSRLWNGKLWNGKVLKKFYSHNSGTGRE